MKKGERLQFSSGRGLKTGAVAALTALTCFNVPSAQAQAQSSSELIDQFKVSTQDEGLKRIGSTAETVAGEVGKRQAGGKFGSAGRVESRIQNRVQNRLNNRIDPSYDPTNSTASSFEVANASTRGTTKPLR